jgi:hypothetical protein
MRLRRRWATKPALPAPGVGREGPVGGARRSSPCGAPPVRIYRRFRDQSPERQCPRGVPAPISLEARGTPSVAVWSLCDDRLAARDHSLTGLIFLCFRHPSRVWPRRRERTTGRGRVTALTRGGVGVVPGRLNQQFAPRRPRAVVPRPPSNAIAGVGPRPGFWRRTFAPQRKEIHP